MKKEYKLYCKLIKDRCGKKGWCYVKYYGNNIMNIYISNEKPLLFLSKKDSSFLVNTQVLICDYSSICFSILLV